MLDIWIGDIDLTMVVWFFSIVILLIQFLLCKLFGKGGLCRLKKNLLHSSL